MRSSSNRRVFLFLMEIVIAILFFAVSGAVCLRTFAKSRTLSSNASDLNFAASNIQNVAELLKASDRSSLNDPDQITELLSLEYDDITVSGEQWIISCHTGYTILVSRQPENGLSSIQSFLITVLRTSDRTEVDHLLLELYTEE